MRRFLSTIVLVLAVTLSASAQNDKSKWTFNTRAWSTNYFTTAIYDVGEILVKSLLVGDNEKDSLWAERIIPDANLVFPIGMGKKGFEGDKDIYGPYHYAFGNPFKHIGDYGVGFDVSFLPTVVGLYAGAYFKSQEIVFKEHDDNLRGFYIQPRFGLVGGNKELSYEAGVFYDAVTGCGGSLPTRDKDMLKNGWGLDFAISRTAEKGHSKTILQFSMPLHNFLNENFVGQQGMKRKVGYIFLTHRYFL